MAILVQCFARVSRAFFSCLYNLIVLTGITIKKDYASISSCQRRPLLLELAIKPLLLSLIRQGLSR